MYTLSENHDNRIKTLHGVTPYPYGYVCYVAFLECEKNKNKNIMINFDEAIRENTGKHNTNRQQFPDHPSRTLILGGFGLEKTVLKSKIPKMSKIY